MIATFELQNVVMGLTETKVNQNRWQDVYKQWETESPSHPSVSKIRRAWYIAVATAEDDLEMTSFLPQPILLLDHLSTLSCHHLLSLLQ